MEVMLLLIGFILCALAAFAGAFFGARTLSDKPLRIPIYSSIKEAVERKHEDEQNEKILHEYFYGNEE